jgi:hypothetical protein
MNLTILDQAKQDLVDGFRFYEIQGVGVGDYFLDSAYAEIDSLVIHAGIHRVVAGFHRLLVRRFPFAIYYRLVLLVHSGLRSTSSIEQLAFWYELRA